LGYQTQLGAGFKEQDNTSEHNAFKVLSFLSHQSQGSSIYIYRQPS
jgi:hypothetical protein